jgi:hypothetical protein
MTTYSFRGTLGGLTMTRPYAFGTFLAVALATLTLTAVSYGKSAQLTQTAKSAPTEATAPVTMTECEGVNNCATWTFLGRQGTGKWPSGEVANLSVEQLDADTIVIRRADSTGSSAGLTAVYKGTRHDDRVGGEFTSSWPSHWDSKSGNWYATIGTIPQNLPSVIRVCAIESPPGWPPCGTWTWNNGHYDALWSELGVTGTVTVVSFTPESVIFSRADYGKETGQWVYKGKLSAQGDSILNGDVTGINNVPFGHFNATWGAATQDIPTAQPQQRLIVRPVICYGWFWVVCR